MKAFLTDHPLIIHADTPRADPGIAVVACVTMTVAPAAITALCSTVAFTEAAGLLMATLTARHCFHARGFLLLHLITLSHRIILSFNWLVFVKIAESGEFPLQQYEHHHRQSLTPCRTDSGRDFGWSPQIPFPSTNFLQESKLHKV